MMKLNFLPILEIRSSLNRKFKESVGLCRTNGIETSLAQRIPTGRLYNLIEIRKNLKPNHKCLSLHRKL